MQAHLLQTGWTWCRLQPHVWGCGAQQPARLGLLADQHSLARLERLLRGLQQGWALETHRGVVVKAGTISGFCL